MDSRRVSGILLHITSLPSRYGIGDLGSAAFEFADFLTRTNQRLWQVLPLGPVGFGASPYSSTSTFAGNPLLISPEPLLEYDLLTEDELETMDSEVQEEAEGLPFKVVEGKNGDAWIEDVADLLEPRTYVTIDLDAFDPSVLPATGTPEPGGLDWYEVGGLLRRVARGTDVVGFDVVELAPAPGEHIILPDEQVVAGLAFESVAGAVSHALDVFEVVQIIRPVLVTPQIFTITVDDGQQRRCIGMSQRTEVEIILRRNGRRKHKRPYDW